MEVARREVDELWHALAPRRRSPPARALLVAAAVSESMILTQRAPVDQGDWTATRPFAAASSVFAHAAAADERAYSAAPRATAVAPRGGSKRKRAGGGKKEHASLSKAVRARLKRARTQIEEASAPSASQSASGAVLALELLRAASEGTLSDGAAMSSNAQFELTCEAVLGCSAPGAAKIEDATLLCVLRQLLGDGGGGAGSGGGDGGGSAMGLHRCRTVVRLCLLPRVRALERPATRVFFDALLVATAASPQAVVDALLQVRLCLVCVCARACSIRVRVRACGRCSQPANDPRSAPSLLLLLLLLLQPLLCEEPIAGGASADAARLAGGAASVSASL